MWVEKKLPALFTMHDPTILFHPAASSLCNRPREIIEIWEQKDITAETFTPSPAPTYAFPLLDPPLMPHMNERGPEVVRKYHVLNSYRPWWASQGFLHEAERPVDLSRTLWLFGGIFAFGMLLVLGTASRTTLR
jgi:hypothetical protein